jgi:C_GCAxxG_C_C family probable redox protein
MEKAETAFKNFETMNCNQSVLSAFGPDYGVREELCRAIGLGFGGGMGKQGKTCGAVTGAYSVISLWANQKPGSNIEKKEIANEKIRKFSKLFVEKHSELDCEKLLDFNIGIPEESAKIKALGYFDTRCPKFIETAANILCRILD